MRQDHPKSLMHWGFCSTVLEILWAFSIYLEAAAILPQLMMLQRTGEAETITTHYLFALGMYRGLYIPNWIYRYFADDTIDPIAVVAGVVQTVLYGDFFYSELLFLIEKILQIQRGTNHLLLVSLPCSLLHQVGY